MFLGPTVSPLARSRYRPASIRPFRMRAANPVA